MRLALAPAMLLFGCATAPPAPPSEALQPTPAAQTVASTQTWRGALRCGPVPGFSNLPLRQPIVLAVIGSTARYDRAVRVADTRIESDVHEMGSGTIAPDGSLTLNGGASGPAYRYVAQYSGLLRADGGASRLSGSQKWTAHRIRPTGRNCSMTLRREG